MCATIFAAFIFYGCEKLEPYSVDAPEDLQKRIDSIAASKPNTGDTTYLIITKTIVGPEDNSAGWGTEFSDYFTIPPNKLLHLEFINYTSGENNWNNWNLVVANGERNSQGYSEYFVLRSDAWGWGNKDFNRNLISHNYPDLNNNGDIWDDFRKIMQGAHVTLEIDHSPTGYVYVTAKAIGTDGTEIVETYNQPVPSTQNLVTFLVCDFSHFRMIKAYLLPSKVTEIVDYDPVSITVEGTPEFIEIGDTNFWGNAVANVTFADGSSKNIDKSDLVFTIIPPDLTTIGNKTIIVSYNKTKEGELTKPVSTFYTLQVKNSVVSIEVTKMPEITTYYYFKNDSIIFNPRGMIVTATYSDQSTAVLSNELLSFSKIPPVSGTQNVEISYKSPKGKITTTIPVTLIKGVGQVGNTDFSSAWWTAFSENITVPSGDSVTFKMYCYSNGLFNWNSPSTILRKADLTEFAVVRMDNYGWGTGYGSATRQSNWNWDIFASQISGSNIVITVKNNGNNTADVYYYVTYANGEKHYQKYIGITVESSDLTCAITTEGSYVVFVE